LQRYSSAKLLREWETASEKDLEVSSIIPATMFQLRDIGEWMQVANSLKQIQNAARLLSFKLKKRHRKVWA
jgi:hypothetical protein